MRIGAFDAGFSFGYGFLGGGKPPLSGSHSLPGSSRHLGYALNCAEDWLTKMMLQHKPDAVVFAIPFIGKKAKPENLRPLFSFAGMIEKVAFTLKIDCYELDEPAARGHFLGAGNVPRKSKAIKLAVMRACRQRGWPCCDDHAGDALCVAAHGLELLKPTEAHIHTPLFEVSK